MLFFSMATSFSAAALAADGIGSNVRMLVGSGYSPDRGAYALDLVRRSAAAARGPGPCRGGWRDRRPGTACRCAGATSTGSGHVNHTVVLTYLEEGRDAFLKDHGIRRDEYVVGRCSVSFRGEIDPAFEAVTVQCAVRELGRSSVTTSERIVDHTGRGAGRGGVRPGALGSRAAGLATDHRRGAGLAGGLGRRSPR